LNEAIDSISATIPKTMTASQSDDASASGVDDQQLSEPDAVHNNDYDPFLEYDDGCSGKCPVTIKSHPRPDHKVRKGNKIKITTLSGWASSENRTNYFTYGGTIVFSTSILLPEIGFYH